MPYVSDLSPDFPIDLLPMCLPCLLWPAASSLVPEASSSGGMSARTAPAAAPASTLTAIFCICVLGGERFLARPLLPAFLRADCLVAGAFVLACRAGITFSLSDGYPLCYTNGVQCRQRVIRPRPIKLLCPAMRTRSRFPDRRNVPLWLRARNQMASCVPGRALVLITRCDNKLRSGANKLPHTPTCANR
jgi:hypothetical protein